MINKLTRKKPNRLLTGRNNYYLNGSQLNRLVPTLEQIKGGGNNFLGLDLSNPFKGINGAAIKNAVASAAGAAVGQIGGGLLGGGMSSGVGDALQGLGGIASAIPGPWGAIASAGLGVASGLTNRMFGSKMNQENIAKVEANINSLNNFQSDASDFDALSQNWANADVGMTFNNSFIGKDGWFSNKAKNKAADLRRQVEAGNAWVQNSLTNNAQNISTTQMQNLLSNYAALGGPLFFAEGGGIHIKPENRGKFTATKKRTGKTTEELTHSKNPLTRKRAIFAQNAKKWHHAFGGDLLTHGANFDTGITLVGNGNTHEQNPYEGVQMGVDPEGTPNLVEEGEVIFNDYVFSNRLKVPKAVRNKYKLRGKKALTFADAALQMAKESEERPNDPISRNGLEALLGELAYAQEGIRAERQAKKKTYAYGGEMGNIFSGDGPETNRLRHDNTSIDFSHLYNKGSKYMTNRDYVLKNWDSPYVQKWREQFIRGINDYNNGLEGFTPYTLDSLTKDEYERLSLDKRYGAVHNGTLALDPSKDTIIKHTLRGADGPVALDPTHAYYAGYSPTTKRTWAEDFGDKYTRVDSGRAQMSVDPETGANVLEYLYDPVKKAEPAKAKKVRFYDYAEKYDKNTPYREYDSLDAAQEAGEVLDRFGAPKDGENFTVYRGLKPSEKMPDFDDPLRYAPVIGSLVGLGTSIFSRPDESEANAILEATRRVGTYHPARFKPVGNYLTYNPFDTEFAANQANAEAAAARRAIMNTSGGNRAAAIAGILAANNNALNQLGALRRGAAEDNLKQRQMVEDFNRATNMFNSEGFFKADTANQSALAQARDLSLRGTMAAEDIRQRAKLARENAIQSNLSGLFTSLGNIGQERVARQQYKWLTDNGYVRPHQNKNGGKINKKKKGLTY